MGRTEQIASDMPRALRVQTMSVYLPGLRKQRERAKLKRAELARRLRGPNGLGIDEDTPGRWELPKANPRHRRTPIGYLSQLAEILGCTEDDLLEDEPRPIVAAAPTEPEPPAVPVAVTSDARLTVTHYYLHGLSCLLCGRAMGTVRTQDERSPLFISRDRRCSACGGMLGTSGDVERITVRPKLYFGPARVGRPPAPKPQPGDQVCNGCHESKRPSTFFRLPKMIRATRRYCIKCLRRYKKDDIRPCARCGEIRTPDEFPVTSRDGAARTCIYCKREYDREYAKERTPCERASSEAAA